MFAIVIVIFIIPKYVSISSNMQINCNKTQHLESTNFGNPYELCTALPSPLLPAKQTYQLTIKNFTVGLPNSGLGLSI